MARTLTRIRLHGFKTFAQRVEIELTHPLVAVVGPNGCGKSNLVDAIIWALGEVSIRSLRAATPSEILFNGSSTEKPLGMAEVALWFDNESRWLPLDADEVQITRRLYRSGEWECWINRTPARLRDVADLFAGTGLGRGGYAIVGQGEIEAFLNADPEERRRWLEELAGIAFYRNRRRDTLRDLEATRLHLQRVGDVLRELERQREPLREQAERARTYRELQQQLRAMERQLLRHDCAQLRHQLYRLRTEQQQMHQQMGETRQAAEHTEAEADAERKQVAHLDAEIETLRTILQAQLSAEERAQGDLKAFHERERTLQELSQTLEEEMVMLREREQHHLRALQLLQARLQTARAARQRALPRLQAAQETLQQHEQARQTVDARYHAALQTHAQHEQMRRERLTLLTRLQELNESEPALQAQQQAAHDALQHAIQHEQAARAEVEQAQAAFAQLEEQLATAQSQQAARQSLLAKLTAQVQALTASLQAGEGASPAVQRLLQAVQRGELQGEYYPVGTILTVPDELQQAMEAALGGSLNDIITPTEAEARAAIEWLKRNRAGRLTFLPLDILNPPVRIPPHPSPLPPSQGGRGCREWGDSTPERDGVRGDSSQRNSSDGIIGWASELVQYDPRFEKAVHYLLRRTLVVDTLENAVRLLKQHPVRMVTLEGELVQPTGTMTGGRYGTERSNLLTLKRQLDDARAALQQLQHEHETHEAEHIALLQQHQQARLHLEQRRQLLHQATQQRLSAEAEQAKAHHALARLRQERETLLQQLNQLETQLAEQPTPDLNALQTERDQIHHAYANALQTLTNLRAEYERLQHEEEETTARLQSEQQQLEQIRQRLQSLEQRRQAISQERAQIQEARARRQQERETLLTQMAETQARLEQLQARRQHHLQRSLELAGQARQLRQQLGQQSERERALELQIARIEVRLAELQEHWQRLFPDEPLFAPPPTGSPHEWGEPNSGSAGSPRRQGEPNSGSAGSPRGQEKPNSGSAGSPRGQEEPNSGSPYGQGEPHGGGTESVPSRSAIEKLRRTLQAMGEVNLGAADEYARLTERIETLTQQRDDLLQTARELERALHDIDRHARQRFEETYEAARAAFRERFQQLFEGGHADLILTDARDPLSAGVLIEAQPPGKRRQRLELLSGGERALTAAALLLAFMAVKPSPLCVLDEVDAALDGRNVQRFADHLQQMAQNTQVIIVTHNPITTAVAKQWVGISMTGGVSRVVPYVPRLPAADSDGLDTRRAVAHLQSQPTPDPISPPISQPPSTSDG
jgi:chromosome segregation protein